VLLYLTLFLKDLLSTHMDGFVVSET